MSVIVEFKAENYKRLKAVRITPDGLPVVPLVGLNGAGKTSILDAITETLAGTRGGAEMPIRRGEKKAECFIDLGDIRITRKWTEKGDTLTVTNAEGLKYPKPQAKLDEALGKLTFNPLKFLDLKPIEQAHFLAEVVGLDFVGFNAKKAATAEERKAVKRTLATAEAQLAGMPDVLNPPPGIVVVADLLAQLTAAQETNRTKSAAEVDHNKNQREYIEDRARLGRGEIDRDSRLKDYDNRIAALQKEREEWAVKSKDVITKEADRLAVNADKLAAEAARVAAMPEIDCEPINARIRDSEAENEKYRQSVARANKLAEIDDAKEQIEEYTKFIDGLDAEMDAAIAKNELPVAGLKLVADGILLNDVPLRQASGAEQLRVSVALGLAVNPKLRIMLIPDGSLLDQNGMKLLVEMAEKYNAQVWIERVDNGHEQGIMIVDGETVPEPVAEGVKS